MTTLVPDVVNGRVSAAAFLRVAMFSGWRPEQVPSRVVVFDEPDFRVERGIARGTPAAACVAQFDGQLTGSSYFPGYDDPESWDTQAQFRYLPDDYTPLGWTRHVPAAAPPLVLPRASVTRSWDKLDDLETWSTAAANESWATLPEYVLEADVPAWLPFGDTEPSLVTGYVYWRANEYVANSAVAVHRSSGLSMTWAPTRIPSQLTVVLVLVPGFMGGASYTLMEASPDIRVSMNSDSTVSLMVPGNDASTVLLGGRTRPNEPVMVALSVTLDGSDKVSLVAVDSNIRMISNVSSAPLNFSGLQWLVNPDGDAVFELLEVDVYTDLLSDSGLAQVSSVIDRIYGVTAL